MRLPNQKVPLCITDWVEDSHVFGRAWIPLFSEGPNTPKADIIGFDDKAARKHGLPIGPHATKVKGRSNRYIILRVLYGVSNETSDHTLLCTFQMRDMQIIVDDINNSHQRPSNGEKVTQCIEFKDGTKVDAICKSALMTFNIEKPTYIENFEGNIPIYDLSQQHWNPQNHFDNIMAIPEEPNYSEDEKFDSLILPIN